MILATDFVAQTLCSVTCCLAGATADVLTAILVAVDDHDAAAPAANIPALAAPAAVPAAIARFVGAVGQRALGDVALVEPRRRWVRDALVRQVGAGSAGVRLFLGRWGGAAVG